VISVPTDADQEKCAQIISRYDLFALPVVDERERLQGIVTVDDVVDVMVDEASEDIHRIGASEPLEQLYLSASTFTLARKQVVWLLLLFVAETLTGTVLRHFEYELSAVVALAFFIPLLIGTGGNAGSQAATTVIRSMTLGEVRFQDLWKVLRKEIILAIILGVTIASVGYLRSLTWGNTPAFALTVAASIMAIILWANIVGSIVPNLAQRIGIDPTVLSAPFVTTLVDGTGLFIYFTIANLILGI
jgi:magnesium transporter